MGLFEYRYLGPEQVKGFDKYKYSSVDTSPLSVYLSHPFWNYVVEFYPRSLAPNTLTLGGWFLVMACFALESFLDYDLTRNSVGSKDPLPQWYWLVAAICTFTAHTMDGTDGKQARRIGASGPTGEMFDHGLDSWSTVPFTITIFSVFGQGEYSVSPLRLLCILISVQVVFIVTHWEKYNTGVLFLSWTYDASQFGLVFVYLFTYYVGYEWFKFHVFSFATFADVFESSFYLCCIGSVVQSLININECYQKKTLKQPSLYEGLRPLVSCFALFATSIFWGVTGSSLNTDPRCFFFAMGTVFSNIACRLIVSQMTSTRAELVNGLLGVYVLAAVVGVCVPSSELLVLRLSTLVILFAHIHYGVCVVRQLCEHFGIFAFDVSYLQKKSK